MPKPAIELTDLSEEDKSTAMSLLDAWKTLEDGVANLANDMKELRADCKKARQKLLDFVEDCRAGEPPLLGGK